MKVLNVSNLNPISVTGGSIGSKTKTISTDLAARFDEIKNAKYEASRQPQVVAKNPNTIYMVAGGVTVTALLGIFIYSKYRKKKTKK